FDAVVNKHLSYLESLGDRDPSGDLPPKVAFDFLEVSILHLANRGHDDYIRRTATTAWHAIKHDRLQLAYADKIGPLIACGVSESDAEKFLREFAFPMLWFTLDTRGIKTTEDCHLFIPPHFVEHLWTQPIDSLAKIAGLCSQIRDVANGRLALDDSNTIIQRANAMQAHFLHDFVQHDPYTVLPSHLKALIIKYPLGVNSLPVRLKYRKGMDWDTYAQNYRNN
ncbi:MAG: hypothetical protein ACMG6E_04165, partial [Candidatus Roizmanbacteria bacterium]